MLLGSSFSICPTRHWWWLWHFIEEPHCDVILCHFYKMHICFWGEPYIERLHTINLLRGAFIADVLVSNTNLLYTLERSRIMRQQNLLKHGYICLDTGAIISYTSIEHSWFALFLKEQTNYIAFRKKKKKNAMTKISYRFCLMWLAKKNSAVKL